MEKLLSAHPLLVLRDTSRKLDVDPVIRLSRIQMSPTQIGSLFFCRTWVILNLNIYFFNLNVQFKYSLASSRLYLQRVFGDGSRLSDMEVFEDEVLAEGGRSSNRRLVHDQWRFHCMARSGSLILSFTHPSKKGGGTMVLYSRSVIHTVFSKIACIFASRCVSLKLQFQHFVKELECYPLLCWGSFQHAVRWHNIRPCLFLFA